MFLGNRKGLVFQTDRMRGFRTNQILSVDLTQTCTKYDYEHATFVCYQIPNCS